jgi:hypothetical protein
MPELTGIPILWDGCITRQVYIGPQHRRLGKLMLWLSGIRHTISLRAEFSDADNRLTLGSHLHIPIEGETAPTIEQLHEAVASIREAVDRGHNVYIHCKQGRGRAPTLAAAYLISEGAHLNDALATLHRARRSISLTPPQLARLEEFADSIRPSIAAPAPPDRPTSFGPVTPAFADGAAS